MAAYQLHIEGQVIHDTNFAYLQRTARLMDKPYVIYQVFESKVHEVIIKNEKNAGRKVRLSDHDIEEINRKHERGYTTKILARNYGVSQSTIDKALYLGLVKKNK